MTTTIDRPRRILARTTPPTLGTLVLGTDLSAAAFRAAGRIPWLRLSHDATIHVLHVLDDGEGFATLGVLKGVQPHVSDVAAQLRSVLRGAGLARVKVLPHVVVGSPYRELVRHATEVHADILVVGRHGRTTARDAILGSTAERVARHAPCPVLVAGKARRTAYRHLLIALGDPEGGEEILRTAGAVLSLGGLRASLVQAYWPVGQDILRRAGFVEAATTQAVEARDAARRVLDALMPVARQLGLRASAVCRQSDPRRLIVGVAAARRCDLTVVGAVERGPLAEALIGSTALHTVRHAQGDVLVIRLRTPRVPRH